MLDAFDLKILAIIQLDAAIPADAIAERIGLSGSAVLRRLRQLRMDRVITSTIAVVDPSKLGRRTTFVVSLEIDSERAASISALRMWLDFEPQVQQAYYVTGGADFVLIVTAFDVVSFEAFMTRMLVENAIVRRYTTNVALAVAKRGLFVPVVEV